MPKQTLTESVTNQIKVNESKCQITPMVTLCKVAEEPDWGELREPTSKDVVKKQPSYLEMVKEAVKALKVLISL